MTMTIDETLNSITDPDLLYWADVLTDLDSLQHKITSLVALAKSPAPAFDGLEWESRYRLNTELGGELVDNITEETIFVWLVGLLPVHTFTRRHEIKSAPIWQKVEVVLQEEPKVTCTWTREMVSEVSLGDGSGTLEGEILLPLPWLKSQFEQLCLEAVGRAGLGVS